MIIDWQDDHYVQQDGRLVTGLPTLDLLEEYLRQLFNSILQQK